MSFWLVVGVCAALFVLVVAVAGSLNLFNQPMSDETSSQPVAALPEDFTGTDVERLRFTIVARGYRPDEVDEALDRMSERIAGLESRLAGQTGGTADDMGTADGHGTIDSAAAVDSAGTIDSLGTVDERD